MVSLSSQKTDIPIRIIKENIAVFAGFLCTKINSAIKPASFSTSLKLAYVTPLHKKGKKIWEKVCTSKYSAYFIKKF